jgi:acetyl-CoA synthetase
MAAGFAWRVPDIYNIGVDVADRQRADADALILVDAEGRVERRSFGWVTRMANRLANVLVAAGARPGDRIAILLGQRAETALAHVATYKLGAIAVPLFVLFGPDALAHRLADSGARLVVTDLENWPKIAALRTELPALHGAIVVDGHGIDGTRDFAASCAAAHDNFAAAATRAEDPAVLIYTSGTTGAPKGALHAHRVLLGHLPGVELPQRFFPQPGDVFWTPADWAWIGGLFDVLLPAWHHGVPVVACRAARFDPLEAFDLMARHGVRNVFLPPTALKLMRQAGAAAARRATLRSIGSGGETLGAELLDWGRDAFGVTINEFYGQTECNLVVANNADLMPVRPGSMGRAVPGHHVAVIDAHGTVLEDGEVGEIAIRRPDPVMFLGYWNDPSATAAKFAGDWLRTGDLGRRDAEGYFWYQGRSDDVITSAGYRIGPAEIEDCLLRHPAVAMAAAIGVPDPTRTEIVKACIVLKPGIAPDETLARAIQNHVRTRLAAHEYPRLIDFVDALPLTPTGKVMRRVLRERHGAARGAPGSPPTS